jgi:hypothetical protein
MAPYFFRGSILITDKIIGYNEFMKMSVFDFERIEAMVQFKNHKIKQGVKQRQNSQIKKQMHGLPVINAADLGFSEEQLKAFRDGNN